MTKTYELECVWHTHDGFSINDKEMGIWTGIMFCEDDGHCYGLIKDDVAGLKNLEFNHYFAGHYEPSKGISFLKAAIGRDVFPSDYTLVKDSRDGYCGEVAEPGFDERDEFDMEMVCGARLKVKEVELTPAKFNHYQRMIENSRSFINNFLSVTLLSGIEQNSSFMMDSVMELAKDNVQYHNNKFQL